MNQCKNCGIEFYPNKWHPKQRYCSKKCSRVVDFSKGWYHKNANFGRWETTKYCVYCKSRIIFDTSKNLNSEMARKYCSKKCRDNFNFHKWYNSHKGVLKVKRKEIYKKNKCKNLEYAKQYRANPENWKKKLQWTKEYVKKRRKEDINFAIKERIRLRIHDVLIRKMKYKKAMDTSKLLGAPIDKVKEYLESKFKEGMCWDNLGEWHIDHIIPCSHFNLIKKEEQKKCFNYKNLQPMWASENCSKQDRYIG